MACLETIINEVKMNMNRLKISTRLALSFAAMVLVGIGLGGLLLLVLYAMTRSPSKTGPQGQVIKAPFHSGPSGLDEQPAPGGLPGWRPSSVIARGGQRPDGCLAPEAWAIETSLHL